MTKAVFEHFLDKFRSGALLVAVIAPLALGGCLPGGDDDDDEDEKGGDGGGEVSTFVGTWSITETGNDGCFDGPFTDTYTITIREENGELVLDDGELVAELEVDGNTASWTLDQSEEGVTAVHTGEATVSGDTINGTTQWSASGEGMSCEGQAAFTGTRVSAGTPDGDDDGGELPTPDAMEVEPNQPMANATVISMSGSTVTYGGSIGDGFDGEDFLDYFAFGPSTNGSYTITLKGDDPMDDIDLAVYRSDGEEAADSSTFGPNESITLSLSAGLVYYIRVYGYETLEGSNYTLTITRN